MSTNRTISAFAAGAVIALTGLSATAQADSCSQAKVDANKAYHEAPLFPAGTYRATTDVSNAIANQVRCNLGNSTSVQDESGNSGSSSDSSDSSSSSSSSDSSGDDAN